MIDALILCEGKFGTTTGKTANGLVRRSHKYRIVGVIDSSKTGQDAGMSLNGEKNGIPIFRDVADALSNTKPKCLIIGVATVGGKLPPEFRPVIADALVRGIDVVSGLHEYLSDDEEFKALAKKHGATLTDIRRPPPLDKRHPFGDRARHIGALRIPILGTDSAIGKRTSAWELVDALNEAGIKAVLVATGQTGLLQGAWYGVPLDSIPGDYMVGELENAIMAAYEQESPQVIVVEGQGAASHPAYVCGSRAIMAASAPSGIVLQHAPKRTTRNYHPELKLPMAGIERERMLIEAFSGSKVVALTINHEQMTRGEVERTAEEWEKKYGLPACDPLWQGCGKLVEAIRKML
ncbi:MAG: DUF1611 domain-containing protein [Euryarchaeota archaeon]|nr:DUF1611 domain-containing protein [Euryarchaeota archaeon]